MLLKAWFWCLSRCIHYNVFARFSFVIIRFSSVRFLVSSVTNPIKCAEICVSALLAVLFFKKKKWNDKLIDQQSPCLDDCITFHFLFLYSNCNNFFVSVLVNEMMYTIVVGTTIKQ